MGTIDEPSGFVSSLVGTSRNGNPVYRVGPASQLGTGTKHDSDKLPLSIVPPELGESACRAMVCGMEKYGRDNWKRLPDFEGRYLDALLRHLTSIIKNGVGAKDPDSGLKHLDHVAANVAFLAWSLENGDEG